MTSTEPSFLDGFIRASAGYIIPIVLLAANLAAYLNEDQSRPYDILGLNVLANLLLLYTYLRDFQPENIALEKNRNVRVCERILAAGSACIVIEGAIKGTVLQVTKYKVI
ncbi:hypothetical protein BKA59DRAFT_549223 [Fusarium tricinctum]|uniref:Uncharacterized protein n=1 Tax=Fusarium tricinctum TaxID=61284 RepID=A0A8K0RT22_9HYPO|nr:hypothetical protein BKA59DRAFT_549223 [Fusarium tricinctum]